MTDNITVTITTPSDREAVVTREFDAPAGLVFDALTRPDLIARWYGPPGSIDHAAPPPHPAARTEETRRKILRMIRNGK